MATDKNKPKTLIIRFNKKARKPKFIGIQEPASNGDSIITKLHGKWDSILTPIPDEEE
jgi:hypothetical protein